MYTHATDCFVRDSIDPWSPFAGANFWNHCIGYQGWRWELFAGGIYLIERLYREVRARRETEIVKVIRHPYGKQVHTPAPWELSLIYFCRCSRDSVPKAIYEIQSRTVAFPQLP